MTSNTRFGWHSGAVKAKSMETSGDLTIGGNMTFGDASTDTLTVNGKLDCNGDVDLGSGNDTINVGTGADTVNLGAASSTVNHPSDILFATTKKAQFRDTGLYINSGADGKLTISADGTGGDDITLSGTVEVADEMTLMNGTYGKYIYFGDTGLKVGSSANGKLAISSDGTGADDISLNGSVTCDGGYAMTGAVTAGLSVTGATTFGVQVSGSANTAFDCQTGTFATGLSLAGTLTNGIIVGACANGISVTGATTTGITVSGNATTAFKTVTGTIGTGISLGGTLTTGIAIGASTTGISLTGARTTGISMAGGLDYTPILIGTKANITGSGVILAGDTDDSGGVQIYADDGGVVCVGDVLSPLRCRYLLTTSHVEGLTQAGIFAQVRTEGTLNITGGVRGAYIFNQAGTITLASSAEYVGINQATTLAGTMSVPTGAMFAGVDINVSGPGAITPSGSGLAAAMVIRSSGTPVWPIGIGIKDNGATIGIKTGTCTTAIQVGGTVTDGVLVSGTSTNAFSTAGGTHVTGLLLVGTLGTGIHIGACAATGIAIEAVDVINTVVTPQSATPGTVRTIYGKNIMFATMTSGNLVGVRGEVNISNSGVASGTAFLYGAQGKLVAGASGGIGSTSIDVGSSHVCGVLGQLDISNCTTTSGHIAPVIASIQDSSNTLRTQVNGIYVEVPTYGSGGSVNSILQGNGGATTCLDFSGVNSTNLLSVPAAGQTCWSATNATGDQGKLAVKIGANTYYVNVYTS